MRGKELSEVSAAQASREQELIDLVVASFRDMDDDRLRTVMQQLVRQLHAFIREVRLTEAEWNAAIAFLTAVGAITDDKRQEFILLSDVLGLSMQVVAVNNEAYSTATEATVFGPFFVEDAQLIQNGEDISFGASGQPCWVEGTVKDTAGSVISGARIEVWEADEDGFYDVQYADRRQAARAHLYSDENGEYRFWGLTPTPYPIPHDGPVGRMLKAAERSPMRASHLHFMVSAPGFRTLVTHIFVEGCDYLDSDSVFGVKQSLVKTFTLHDATESTPDGRGLDGKWTRARFDIVLPPTKL